MLVDMGSETSWTRDRSTKATCETWSRDISTCTSLPQLSRQNVQRRQHEETAATRALHMSAIRATAQTIVCSHPPFFARLSTKCIEQEQITHCTL